MSDIKILIADDIFLNRVLFSSTIESLGHVAKMTENGKKAIELLEKEDFDIIFLDIEMPIMNGFETAKYIRTKMKSPKNKIPIIALTAHNIREYQNKIIDSGFSSVVSKPYTIEKLSNIIKKHIK